MNRVRAIESPLNQALAIEQSLKVFYVSWDSLVLCIESLQSFFQFMKLALEIKQAAGAQVGESAVDDHIAVSRDELRKCRVTL